MENKNTLKIISLSGFGKVTNNMFAYETEKDILLVDAGIGFPTEEMLGVDLLIPDVSYLQTRMEKIRGLVITHGHDDHIGAIPYILPKLPNIPIYGSRWALALIEGKIKEYGLQPRLEEINFMDPLYRINLGDFKIEAIEVTHSIPETLHLVIHTPMGTVYHAADFKLDLTPVMGRPTDQKRIAEIGKNGVLCLLSDCLRAERPGFTPPERTLEEGFEREINDCRGRYFVTTMSSNISRFKQAIDVSLRHGRKIVLVGRSVEKNIEVALKLGYFKYSRNIFVPFKVAEKMSRSSLTYLVAGSQAQAGSALERIVTGDHDIKIEPGDKVVISSDYIPGNELAVYNLIDNIFLLGAEVAYTSIASDLHVSGHGAAQDLKKLMDLVHPKYLMPIGGNYHQMIAYQKLAVHSGYRAEDVLLPYEGHYVEFTDGQVNLNKEVHTGTLFIDALGVGDVGNVVLRDRQVLSQEGIVVAIIVLNHSTTEIIGDPEIVTRGFVYVKNSEELIGRAREEIKIVINRLKGKKASVYYTREEIINHLEKLFFQETGRRPMIIPQIIEV